jgi:protein SCO1/2
MANNRFPIFACAVVGVSIVAALTVLLGPWRPWTSAKVVFNAAIIPGQTPDLLSDMSIPPFSLMNHNGVAVDETLFDERFTIVDFFFTRCPGPCPMMTQQMRRIQTELTGTDVRFVSFSVDGDNEPPHVLTEYARANGADLSTWTFLTGDPAEVYRIATEGLSFALERDPSIQIDIGGGKTTDNIIHPTHLILVGPDRKVWALAGFTNEENIELVVEAARSLSGRLKRR